MPLLSNQFDDTPRVATIDRCRRHGSYAGFAGVLKEKPDLWGHAAVPGQRRTASPLPRKKPPHALRIEPVAVQREIAEAACQPKHGRHLFRMPACAAARRPDTPCRQSGRNRPERHSRGGGADDHIAVVGDAEHTNAVSLILASSHNFSSKPAGISGLLNLLLRALLEARGAPAGAEWIEA
jgi:hypothetical protein